MIIDPVFEFDPKLLCPFSRMDVLCRKASLNPDGS